MPLIKPKKKESKDDFVKRFMSSASAKKEFTDEDQRIAVAYDRWKEAFKQNSGVFNQLRQNMSKLIRYDSLNDREHLVAPLILIKEGVLDGSDGPIKYNAEDIASSARSWNHKPVVVYHPTMNNKPLSAANKHTIEKQQIGILLDVRYEGNSLKANAWIDVEKANKVDPRIIDMLENNEMLEVSTGLFTDDIITNGEWEGKQYDKIATNYRPDHLAVLPDMTGACSIADGAGLPRINQDSKNNKPIKGEIPMDRKEKIEKLVANSANGWIQEDSDFLSGLEEDKFEKLFSMNREEPVANAEAKPEEPVAKEEVKPEPVKEEAPVANTEAEKEEPVVNSEPVTLASYVESAPAEFKPVIEKGVALYNKERSDLVEKLTANAKCLFTAEQLADKPNEELSILSQMLPEPQVAPVVNFAAQAGPVAKPAVKPLITPNYL